MASGHGMNRVARVENFARAGYAARGVVYILLGYFALGTAGAEDGQTSVLRQIQDLPLGTILLVLVGLGLAGWGLYRLYGAAVDIQGKGTDAKGLGTRIGHALSGILHFGLCFLACASPSATARPDRAGATGRPQPPRPPNPSRSATR